jgi:hypothetical protein
MWQRWPGVTAFHPQGQRVEIAGDVHPEGRVLPQLEADVGEPEVVGERGRGQEGSRLKRRPIHLEPAARADTRIVARIIHEAA